MRITIPRGGESLVSKDGLIASTWSRFLEQFVGSLGHNDGLVIYEDLSAGIGALDPNSSGAAMSTVASGLQALMFDAASDESALFSLKLPNAYAEGGSLQPYVDWAPVNGNSGNVRWQIEYGIASAGDAITATTITKESAAPETADEVTRASFDAISGSGLEPGDVILGRVIRDADNAGDTYGSDAALLVVGFKVPVRGVGHEKVHP